MPLPNSIYPHKTSSPSTTTATQRQKLKHAYPKLSWCGDSLSTNIDFRERRLAIASGMPPPRLKKNRATENGKGKGRPRSSLKPTHSENQTQQHDQQHHANETQRTGTPYIVLKDGARYSDDAIHDEFICLFEPNSDEGDNNSNNDNDNDNGNSNVYHDDEDDRDANVRNQCNSKLDELFNAHQSFPDCMFPGACSSSAALNTSLLSTQHGERTHDKEKDKDKHSSVNTNMTSSTLELTTMTTPSTNMNGKTGTTVGTPITMTPTKSPQLQLKLNSSLLFARDNSISNSMSTTTPLSPRRDTEDEYAADVDADDTLSMLHIRKLHLDDDHHHPHSHHSHHHTEAKHQQVSAHENEAHEDKVLSASSVSDDEMDEWEWSLVNVRMAFAESPLTHESSIHKSMRSGMRHIVKCTSKLCPHPRD